MNLDSGNYVLFTIKFEQVNLKWQMLPTLVAEFTLSYDVASGSEITACIKIDKPLVVYRFSGNIVK